MITIQHYLPRQSISSVEIFDILARKIETLAEEIRVAGNHQTGWDARGQVSGIYLYRIKAGQGAETKGTTLPK